MNLLIKLKSKSLPIVKLSPQNDPCHHTSSSVKR